MFVFRNPGLMRVSIEQAISGYEHDCRNEKLHQMLHFKCEYSSIKWTKRELKMKILIEY